MERSKLQLLISVPHGGMKVPGDIQTECLLSPEDILMDGDTWTRELFDFSELAVEFHEAEVARIVVDLNRDPADLPPDNPDGIVKTLTVDGQQVWETADGLSELEREKVIQDHYAPYHDALAEAALNPDVKLAVDCHSMLDYGPSKHSPDWEHRPLFCISNRGNFTGGPEDEELTAPQEILVKFQDLLEKKFAPFLGDQVAGPYVALNDPFKGGYITRHHGQGSDVPWIQLEINRKVYLPADGVVPLVPGDYDMVRLTAIRDILYDVFEELVKDVSPFKGKEAL